MQALESPASWKPRHWRGAGDTGTKDKKTKSGRLKGGDLILVSTYLLGLDIDLWFIIQEVDTKDLQRHFPSEMLDWAEVEEASPVFAEARWIAPFLPGMQATIIYRFPSELQHGLRPRKVTLPKRSLFSCYGMRFVMFCYVRVGLLCYLFVWVFDWHLSHETQEQNYSWPGSKVVKEGDLRKFMEKKKLEATNTQILP